jgi:hypothetical protein
MAKKKIEIPDDMTSKLVGTIISYPTPPLFTPVQLVQELVAQPKNLGGRPIKQSSVGRLKYTTVLSKDLIRFLRVEAAQRDMTPADLLEIVLTAYKEKLSQAE